MTKRQLIEEITHRNPTAKPAFLAEFGNEDLREYLEHLRWVEPPSTTWRAAPDRPPGLAAEDAPHFEMDEPLDKTAPEIDEQLEQEIEEPGEVVAIAADAQDSSTPFAESSSQEEPPSWLF